ncbi:aminotransferase class V-fold PLP-dependent enzyme [Amycolatopsis sp. NPDC052450]|uniref:aminotransferase class V-fold PLP-dependent enzyme n=1 Tax=Amycolatopsis sp. NPDC052450 TaxID=3363937 RepID=UPI0037C836E8
MLEQTNYRADFPAFTRPPSSGRKRIYLDNAATSQKPHAVITAMNRYFESHCANVHRGSCWMAQEATADYEAARVKVAEFVNAPSAAEVVFTRNATEALNLVANTLAWAEPPLKVAAGDEIVTTRMEHHSNLLPWRLLAQRVGATLRYLDITDDGLLDLAGLPGLITERTKVVAVVHTSNILGTVNDLAPIVRRARQVGALVVVDASQTAPHMPLDVQRLGADVVAFTGHKMFGPTGVGVLWGRRELLEALPPFFGGGNMIDTVTGDSATYAAPPHKFEAGTPAIAEVIGLGAAVDYLTTIGMDTVARHERHLVAHALAELDAIPGLRIIGPRTADDRGSVISFVSDTADADHIGRSLDRAGIAVRTGRHCAALVCDRFRVPATIRVSVSLYNTHDDIDHLITTLRTLQTHGCRPAEPR